MIIERESHGKLVHMIKTFRPQEGLNLQRYRTNHVMKKCLASCEQVYHVIHALKSFPYLISGHGNESLLYHRLLVTYKLRTSEFESAC